MKSFVFFVVFAVVALNASASVSSLLSRTSANVPIISQQQVPIISQEQEINPDGSYKWSYQSGDGTAQQQVGVLKPIGDGDGQAVQGNAVWYDPEGNTHELAYKADEEGYQPSSADLPVAPEIPAYIARSLVYNAAHPEQETE